MIKPLPFVYRIKLKIWNQMQSMTYIDHNGSRDKILQLQRVEHRGGGGTSSCTRTINTINTSKNEEGGQCGKSKTEMCSQEMLTRSEGQWAVG